MQKLLFGLAVCTIWALMQGPAMAAPGTALGVNPAAEAKRKAETHVLAVGSDIFIGDRVVTGASGQVQIKFDDRTELVVGPRSSLLIEDYLLRADGSAGKLALNALAGTFRFVTGGAPKESYTIKTPTATIGVRGTAFELYVTKAWTYILMHDGSVVSSNGANQRIVLDAACEVGQVSSSDAIVVGDASTVQGDDRARLRQIFIYAVNQRPLLREFRIANAERCLQRAAPGGPPGSLIEQPPPREPTPPAPPPPPPIDTNMIR